MFLLYINKFNTNLGSDELDNIKTNEYVYLVLSTTNIGSYIGLYLQ